MALDAGSPETVEATLNYAADRSDGGEFSNTQPSLARQKLVSGEVKVRNMRAMDRRPTLPEQGLTFAHHPRGKADWANRDWLQGEYSASCVDLVKSITGAKSAISMYAPVIRRGDPNASLRGSPTAPFIHIDQTRDYAAEQARAHGAVFKRAAIYNVWKSITPPPQDPSLAVADWRTIQTADHVLGATVEPMSPTETLISPYIVLAPPSQISDWYYVPDLGLDESLVFVGVDLDPAHPLGCAHSAFATGANTSETRMSIEARVLAIFE